ncbi:hypothetical protein [Reyranella soli]|jgi:hypothetical protein|uniref:Uncharacterized protein n=1 Tax=Reyranella soli TaxID=1230389 RepID=A0A512NMK1_9HYPH|nr:hypothetical protein [Reyranella soli]GEP60170.1 hypothetical protein RSO01_73360 [Reyranella soli]
MTDRDVERKLLADLRRTPNAAPAEALLQFRRRLLELELEAKGKVR